MPKRTLLLFDVDATLLHTHGAGGRAMEQAGVELFGDHFSVQHLHFGGSLDSVIYQQAAEHNQIENHDEHHDRFRDTYLLKLEAFLASPDAHVIPLPGIHDVLTNLRQRRDERDDVALGLLTGNYAAATPIKLRAAEIDPDWFSFGAFGDEGTIRADLTALAMQRYEQYYGEAIEAGRVIVIGDTPRDVACAKAHDCVAFCVATGRYSVAELLEAGADVAVSDLADPTPLYNLLPL